MDQLVRQMCQLGDVSQDIGPLRVETLALEDGVENAMEGRSIEAAARYPLPAEDIVRLVGIDQCVPKLVFSDTPIAQKMFDEKGADNHPHPVVHPPGLPKLAHARVDERKAGATFLLGSDLSGLNEPGYPVEVPDVAVNRQGGKMMQHMAGIFAPDQFIDEFIGILR